MKRKAFNAAVKVAMGKTKTKGSAGKRKAAKYAAIVNNSRFTSRMDTTLRRLITQKKRLARALDRAPSRAAATKIHLEAIHIFTEAASTGDEFAKNEQLDHLRTVYKTSVSTADRAAAVALAEPKPDPDPETAAAAATAAADAKLIAAAAASVRGTYVIALLSASEVDDALAALNRWDASVAGSTELAFSKALLTYVAWRPNRVDDDAEEDDPNAAELDAVPEVDEDEGGAGAGAGAVVVSSAEQAAIDALTVALHSNRHVGEILAYLDEFTGQIEPGTLAEARVGRTEPGYTGSIEEALTYIADAGAMWLDRPGLEEWVGGVLAKFTTEAGAAEPRTVHHNKRYLRLFQTKLQKAKDATTEGKTVVSSVPVIKPFQHTQQF